MKSTIRESDFIGMGYGLDMGGFKSSLDDLNARLVQVLLVFLVRLNERNLAKKFSLPS